MDKGFDDLSLHSYNRYGQDKWQCKECGEKFKCGINAESHLVKHDIHISKRKHGGWKKYFKRLC